jgi:hypothetical protein
LQVRILLGSPAISTRWVVCSRKIRVALCIGIRHFGNFSAHPTEDVTTLQIIDVEPGEAEWCLDILEDMFEHFYVRPADAAARNTALDAKLAAAGKLPSK